MSSTVATGTLTASDGTLLWSDSKQGQAGVVHTGAGDAAGHLLESLYFSAGCTGNGRRKVAVQSGPGAVAALAEAQPPNLTLIRKVYLAGTKARAIRSGPRDLAQSTCLQAVKDPAGADAVVILEQSDEVPRGTAKRGFSRAALLSKDRKTVLWRYDEGEVFQSGANMFAWHQEWWAQLNLAVGCGKARTNTWHRKWKPGDWPAPTSEPTN